MSVILLQSDAAGFPDRPATGGVGLGVVLGVGPDGRYVAHTSSIAAGPVHVRFCFAPRTTSGGAVVIAASFDSTGSEVARIHYDTSSRQITLAQPAGPSVAATLDARDWRHVEYRIDTALDEMELLVDGVSIGAATLDAADRPTQHWLGCVLKEDAVVGECALDEWVIADEPIGPVVRKPDSPYGDDPARWLVVFNAAIAGADDWAEHYRLARDVPVANLCGLDLPTSEIITAGEFTTLTTGLNDYLSRNNLAEQIVGVLLGYGVPGYVDRDGLGALEAVGALLHTGDTTLNFVFNPHATDAIPIRPTIDALAGLRMTARIDAPTLSQAIALVDLAVTLGATPLDDAGARLWFDPFGGDGATLDPIRDRMTAWGQSIDRMRTRLPITWSGTPGVVTDASFSSIDGDAFFWGWNTASPPADFFADPAGARVFCGQFDVITAESRTLRSASPSNWIDTALDAGYASAAAGCKPYSPGAVPYARPFFEALRQGWTLAEAWFVALPILREGLYLVGDPLMRVPLPQAGWDVFGPLDALDSLDPAQPILALRHDETSIALADTHRPAEDEDALYLVRAIDVTGRSEASVRPISLHRLGDAPVAVPTPPLWPDHADWSPPVRGGATQLTLMFDRSLRDAGLVSIELLEEVEGTPEAVVETIDAQSAVHAAQASCPLPDGRARYRWRMTPVTGPARDTAWSAWLEGGAIAGPALQLVEESP